MHLYQIPCDQTLYHHQALMKQEGRVVYDVCNQLLDLIGLQSQQSTVRRNQTDDIGTGNWHWQLALALALAAGTERHLALAASTGISGTGNWHGHI